MRVFYFSVFIIIIGVYSCRSKKSTDTLPDPGVKDTSLRFFQDQNLSWQYDSQGNMKMSGEMMLFCMNWKKDTIDYSFRNKYIQALNGSSFFNEMQKNDLIFLMGFDKIHRSAENEIITYNMEWGCKNPEFDCCWIEFYLDEKGCVSFTSVMCS